MYIYIYVYIYIHIYIYKNTSAEKTKSPGEGRYIHTHIHIHTIYTNIQGHRHESPAEVQQVQRKISRRKEDRYTHTYTYTHIYAHIQGHRREQRAEVQQVQRKISRRKEDVPRHHMGARIQTQTFPLAVAAPRSLLKRIMVLPRRGRACMKLLRMIYLEASRQRLRDEMTLGERRQREMTLGERRHRCPNSKATAG